MLDGIFAQFGPGADRPEDAIREGAAKNLFDTDFIAKETISWLNGKTRELQRKGTAYYRYEHDVLRRDNHAYSTDADGAPVPIDNHKCSKIMDNQYANMVDQKVNYILGKPFSLQTNNEKYLELMNIIFDKHFRRMMHEVAIDALNGGIAWVHPYYDEKGELGFKRFAPEEICPFWADDEHTVLDMAIRYYESIVYIGREATTVKHIEVYTKEGIKQYVLSAGRLIADKDAPETVYAMQRDEEGSRINLTWERVPLVAFKYNPHEIPLIKRTMSLQDAINNTRSNWNDSMNEDIRDTILVLANYDGENIENFREKLMKYGAVLVGEKGAVTTLRIERDHESYTTYLKETKKALIENARGFDAKDDRMSSNPNEMNLRSAYASIDLDADMMEMQFQAAFDQLLWFVDQYLQNAGQGDFTQEEVQFTFNRNMIVNNSEVIGNIKDSWGIVSTETLLANHPFVPDVQAEINRVQKEKQQSKMDAYKRAFRGGVGDEA